MIDAITIQFVGTLTIILGAGLIWLRFFNLCPIPALERRGLRYIDILALHLILDVILFVEYGEIVEVFSLEWTGIGIVIAILTFHEYISQDDLEK